MASVWVPFTSESKEAIADYDEIRKDITLALRECGRRLGLFLRRRERAQGEYRRRNIFELYIEEVAEACNRLKGGKLRTEKLKAQLQKIANSRTGGMKTDETLGKIGGGPEGLPHSIIVTPEGIEGEVAVAVEGAGPGLAEVVSTPQTDLLSREPLAGNQSKTGSKPARLGSPAVKLPKGTAVQLGLFAGKSSGSRKSHAKPGKAGKASTARHRK